MAPNVAFIQSGEAGHRTVAGRSALFPGKCWEMRVDLDKQLVFPTEITETSQRPDVVMWSTAAKKVLVIELTAPWEEGISAAHELKRKKYSDLAEECKGGGWSATIHPVEVGRRGFVGGSRAPLFSGTPMSW